MIADGKMAEVLDIASRTNAARDALIEAGFTLYGTPVREECTCWFYQRAPWAHDAFLDLPELPAKVGWSLILQLVGLDAKRAPCDSGEPLFVAPEEIGSFTHGHDMHIEDVAKQMMVLARQAQWGRLRDSQVLEGVPA
jgi:hypothetical protein